MLGGLFKKRHKAQPTATVMAVGDDQGSLDLLTTTLEMEGIQVMRAADVEAAIKKLTDMDMPDLFIGDFSNPERDGTEFMRRLHIRYGKASLPPVIFLLDSIEDEVVAHTMGVTDVITKPLQSESILRCIKSVMTTG
jgi:DNA-binding response OmpR family regulator